jgi:hypothetical protein
MTSTPQDPSGSNPPQWNNPGQQSPQGSYPGYPGGQPEYQQPYGQGGQPQYGGDMKRPGTVTAAAVIAIVMSALTGIFWVLLGLAMLLAGDRITDALLDEPEVVTELERANITPSQLQDSIAVFGVIFVVIGLIMLAVIFAARSVLKGSKAGRIVLVIASVITLLLGLLMITSGIAVIWMIAAIAVIVLLYVGDANRWFEARSR